MRKLYLRFVDGPEIMKGFIIDLLNEGVEVSNNEGIIIDYQMYDETNNTLSGNTIITKKIKELILENINLSEIYNEASKKFKLKMERAVMNLELRYEPIQLRRNVGRFRKRILDVNITELRTSSNIFTTHGTTPVIS